MRVANLSRSFGGVQAVKDVSFEVARGGITGLIGPNGAGKSTLVNLVAGSIKPDAGDVWFDGRVINDLSVHQRACVGLVRTFQRSSEFGNLSVLENLLVGAPSQKGESYLGALRGKRYWRSQEMANVAHAMQLLERFDMAAKVSDRAGSLSGGQKRLVEIMRALMAYPKLLVLDEPMAGIHPDLGFRIAGYLEQIRDEGMTMLMIEHELAMVEMLCNPVVVMAHGAVVAKGRMEELREHPEVIDAYVAG